MGILYALVARGLVVLAEHSVAATNANTIARRILENLSPGDNTRVSYSQDRHIFHVVRSDGIVYLCMATEEFGRRIPFAFLEEISSAFVKSYGRAAQTALAYSMNEEFSRVLQQQMDYYSNDPNADPINRARGELNDVRAVMVENIDKILERGDRIELLVDKTTDLQQNAFRLKKQARRHRQSLWMKNLKLTGCLVVVIICIICLLLWWLNIL